MSSRDVAFANVAKWKIFIISHLLNKHPVKYLKDNTFELQIKRKTFLLKMNE